jgi:hypothetical protein
MKHKEHIISSYSETDECNSHPYIIIFILCCVRKFYGYSTHKKPITMWRQR